MLGPISEPVAHMLHAPPSLSDTPYTHTVYVTQGGVSIHTHTAYLTGRGGYLRTPTPACKIRHVYTSGIVVHSSIVVVYYSHTGRRFQSESTLQDIEIVQICTISISR